MKITVHAVKCTGTHRNFSSATMNYPSVTMNYLSAVFSVYVIYVMYSGKWNNHKNNFIKTTIGQHLSSVNVARIHPKYYLLMVRSIPTLHLKTFERLFWPATWRKSSRKAQWQAQSRYLCHCAFLFSFRYAGFEKTWPNHFISISFALVTLPAVLRR